MKQHQIENYKVVRFNQTIPFKNGIGGMITVDVNKKGVILSTRSLAEIELNFGNQIVNSVAPLMAHYRSYDGQDLTDKKMLIIREGGIGDLLFTTPSIKYLFEKYNCIIDVSCAGRYHQVFESNPHVNKILFMPLLFEDFDSYDYHISFQGLIEENTKDSQEMNAYDIYIQQFGLTGKIPDSDKKPTLIPDSKCSAKVGEMQKEIFGENFEDRIRIFIHYSTSSKIRTYPGPRWFEMIDEILKIDDRINVYIIDSGRRESEVESFIKMNSFSKDRVYNLCKYSINLHFAFAMVEYCHLMIGSDSSMLHVAAAYDKPIIGLYGPFPSEIRLKYYKNTIGLDMKTKCSPCFLHTGEVACPYGDPSPCLQLLQYDTIVDSIKKLLRRRLEKNLILVANRENK